MSNLGQATGLIGTAVGLGVLLGVTGLAFRAIEQTFPDGQRRRKRPRDGGIFGIDGTQRRAGKRRRQTENIFDLGLTQRPAKKGRKFSNEFGGDFDIFAV